MPATPVRTLQSANYKFNNDLAGQKLKDGAHVPQMKSNTKSFENFSYFLGGIDVTHQNLDAFTPYIRGISRIYMHKVPVFMNAQFPDQTKRFKTYIESGYRSVNGISDVDVEFTSFEGGFNGQQYQTVQSARDTTESISISVYELTGSPIREYLDMWVSGVRDYRSGIAHYHGAVNSGTIDYEEINHTCEFIYTTHDPTGLDIEYCCMFAHCFPRSVPKSHLEYEAGNRDNAQLDLQFTCTKYESPAINDIGVWYTVNSKVDWNYLDFDPERNGSGAMKNAYTYDYGMADKADKMHMFT